MNIINKRKIYNNDYLRYISSYLCILFLISKYYMDIIFKNMYSPLPKLFLLGALLFTCVLLVIKVLNRQVYKVELFLGAIFFIHFLITGNTLFLLSYIFSIALGQIEFKKIIKCCLLISLFYFILILILANQGIIPIDYVGIRSDLGFKNPNTAFISFFIIWSSFLYLYLKSDEHNKYDRMVEIFNKQFKFNIYKLLNIMVLIITPLLVYSQTKTRTGLLTIIFTFIFIILLNLLKNRNISLKFLEYIPQVITLLSVILAIFASDSRIFNKILSDRPKYWNMYLTHSEYGLNLQGYDNNIREIVFSERLPLDSGYIFGIYAGGLIIFILFIKIISLSIRELIKDGKIAEIVFMVSILIYSFAETILLDVNTNPALILVYYYSIKQWKKYKTNRI